jgi:ComF family protein
MPDFVSSPAKKYGNNPYGSIAGLSLSIVKNIRDFIYPSLCIICDNPLSDQDPWLCSSCIEKLRTNTDSRKACPRCGQNMTYHTCACEVAWDHPYQRVFSLFDYDDTVRSIVKQIKYQGKKSLAHHIGKLFATRIPDDFLYNADAMLAVPLYFMRKFDRGYNQAERFAHGIAAGMDNRIPLLNNVLLRTRHTRTQTKLDREKRKKNLAGAFAVNSSNFDKIKGKTLILIDDVVTTGATTGQCAETLLGAGASTVRVLSLARD